MAPQPPKDSLVLYMAVVRQTPLPIGAVPQQTQPFCCIIQDALWSVSQQILVWKTPTFSHISMAFTRRGDSTLNLSMRYKCALAEAIHTTSIVFKLQK